MFKTSPFKKSPTDMSEDEGTSKVAISKPLARSTVFEEFKGMEDNEALSSSFENEEKLGEEVLLTYEKNSSSMSDKPKLDQLDFEKRESSTIAGLSTFNGNETKLRENKLFSIPEQSRLGETGQQPMKKIGVSNSCDEREKCKSPLFRKWQVGKSQPSSYGLELSSRGRISKTDGRLTPLKKFSSVNHMRHRSPTDRDSPPLERKSRQIHRRSTAEESIVERMEQLFQENSIRNGRSIQNEAFSRALKSLFIFDGDPMQLQKFLFIGDSANAVCQTDSDRKLLIQQILSNLAGPIFNKCALYKRYSSYEELKTNLIRMCGATRTVQQIQEEISRLRLNNEKLAVYGNRATQLLAELNAAQYAQYGRHTAEANYEAHEETVTRAYMRGLSDKLSIIVMAGRHKKLNQAIAVAEDCDNENRLHKLQRNEWYPRQSLDFDDDRQDFGQSNYTRNDSDDIQTRKRVNEAQFGSYRKWEHPQFDYRQRNDYQPYQSDSQTNQYGEQDPFR